MKKKGFTLVELLAVITILAILVILALPNVIELFNEAKINAFVLDVQKIMDSAKGEFVSDKFSSTSGETIYYSSIDDDGLNTSKLNSEIPGKEYFIEMDRNGNFKRVVVYDNKFCYDIYTEGTNADLSDSNSKLISEIIKKTNVSRDDVVNNETANAEVAIEYDGDKYIVKGCDSSAIGPTEPERTDNLYTVVKNDFTNNSTITKKYSKDHKDSYSKSATHDIYYYTATDATNAELLSEKINVVFANQVG